MRINGLWTIAKVKAKSVFTFTPIADIWGGSAEGNNGSKSYVYFFDDGMEIREKTLCLVFFLSSTQAMPTKGYYNQKRAYEMNSGLIR